MQQAQTLRATTSSDSQQLRLLCLDGGGVRGLSSLLILKMVMEMIDPDDPPKPCDYFDMIGGTSTGGLIAIMLGRLQMDIQVCIDEYKSLFSSIFTKKKHRINWDGKLQGRFDHNALEEGIKRIVESHLGDENALFKDRSHQGGCKTFVCATSETTSETVVISSYHSSRRLNDIRNVARIWEVGRATSAAMSFFDPIRILGSAFLDGGTGANNPVNKLWAEAEDMFRQGPGWRLEDNVLCLMSIGTGQPLLQKFGNSILGTELLNALVSITTNTEFVANEFQQSHANLFEQGLAFRFNVEQGLETVALEDAESVTLIEEATRRYIVIEKSNALLRKCVWQLRLRESLYNIPRNVFQQSFIDWTKRPALAESDLDLCFIPHTVSYATWIHKGGILAYQKPPTRNGEIVVPQIAGKLLAYIVANCDEEQANTGLVLYYDCASRPDPITLLSTWCLQILAFPVPAEVRSCLSTSLFGNAIGPNVTDSQILLDMVHSSFSLQALREVFVTAIRQLRSGLLLGLDNLDALLQALKPRDRKNDPTYVLVVSLLAECVQIVPSAFIVVTDTAGIKVGVTAEGSNVEVFQTQWNTEWRECLNTMEFDRRLDRQKEIVRAEPGTTAWFWRHPSYLVWRDTPSGILWIQGKPGSGKSVLARNILDPIGTTSGSTVNAKEQKELSQEVGTQVCEWYYSTRGGDELMAHISLLRSLLFQLLSGNSRLFEHFTSSYRRYKPGSCDWITLGNLKDVFSFLADASVSALCLIDAMDESDDDESKGRRKHVLSFFASAIWRNVNSRLKFLILSRPEHDIEMFFTRLQNSYHGLGVIRLHESNDEAIRIIINSGIDSLKRDMRPSEYSDDESNEESDRSKRTRLSPIRAQTNRRLISRSSELYRREQKELDKIKEFLVENAQGVILWVTITVATVKSIMGPTFYTWKEVRKVLEELPTDLSALYKRIVEDICRRLNSQQLEVARRILMWITGANNWRPLRIVELREAITVRPQQEEFSIIVNVRWEDFRYRLRRYCGPFVDIIPAESGKAAIEEEAATGGNAITRFDIVQLLHRTAKDFLADPIDSKELHFRETNAQSMVVEGLSNYDDMLKHYLSKPEFKSAVKGLSRGDVISFVKKLIGYIEDRGLLLHILARRGGQSDLGIDAANLFVRQPLEILKIANASRERRNLRTSAAVERSWFDEPHARSPSSGQAMFVGECLFEACRNGCITAVEILLKISLDFADDRETNPIFFSQMIHSLLLASVEIGNKELTYVLSNMSLSLHQRDSEQNASTLEAHPYTPHKLWERHEQHMSQSPSMFASHLEITAAETGCDALVSLVQEQADLLGTRYASTSVFRKPTIAESNALLSYTRGFGQDYRSKYDNGDKDSQMAIEVAVDHLKLTFRGLKAVATLCNVFVSRMNPSSPTSSSLRQKLTRACALYYASGDIPNARKDRLRYITKKYSLLWIKRIRSVYFRREGLFGVVTAVIERMRQEKSEAEGDSGEDGSASSLLHKATAIWRSNHLN